MTYDLPGLERVYAHLARNDTAPHQPPAAASELARRAADAGPYPVWCAPPELPDPEA